MEEILKKANELGLMLKDTGLYRKYDKITKDLEADAGSKKLLDDYMNLFEEYHRKESSGSVIEIDEKEKLMEIQKNVSENQLLVKYIDTKNNYVNMILKIQKVLVPEDIAR